MRNPYKHTSQAIDNSSFDETYEQVAVELMVENVAETALVRQKPIATEAKQDDIKSSIDALGKNDGDTFTDGDKGVMMLGVRNTAQNSYSASSNIANPIATDSYGNVLVLGNIAHDSADAGNPLKIGGKARTAEPSAVGNNDRVDAYFDQYGYLMTKVSGGATEAKQDDIITAIGGISGTSAYNEAYGKGVLSSGYYYWGYLASTGTAWRIKRLNATTNALQWASGASDLATAWADKENQSFSSTL